MSEHLTPVDILNLRFRRRIRGYAIAEVDDFVRRVAADMEAVLTECAQQREKLQALERELSQYRSLEGTMRDALILAQKAAEETRASARAQAEALLQEASARARDLDARAQTRFAETAVQIETLRQERRRLARDLRAQLTSYLTWVSEELTESSGEPEASSTTAIVVETAIADSQRDTHVALNQETVD